jgi:hypothetical protein
MLIEILALRIPTDIKENTTIEIKNIIKRLLVLVIPPSKSPYYGS